jgi:hypothetical protein
LYSKILPVVYNKKEYLKYLSNVFDASRADEIVEVSSSLKENVVTEAENFHANLLKNNSRSTTSSSSPVSSSVTVTKRYLSKFKREWLSDVTYSLFLREYKNDTTINLSGENNNHSDKRKLQFSSEKDNQKAS